MHTNFPWSCYKLQLSNLGYKPRIDQAIPIVPFPPMLLAVFIFITSYISSWDKHIHVNGGGRRFKLHLMILNEPNIHDNIGTTKMKKVMDAMRTLCLEWGTWHPRFWICLEKLKGIYMHMEWGLHVWMFPYKPCSNYRVQPQPWALGMSHHPSLRC